MGQRLSKTNRVCDISPHANCAEDYNLPQYIPNAQSLENKKSKPMKVKTETKIKKNTVSQILSDKINLLKIK
jgi:hypothetical protein